MSVITNEIFESYRDDQRKIKEAKKFLKSKGYYTDCMWQTIDVTDKYKCDKEDAYEILDLVLGSDCSDTFESIDIQADLMNIKRKEQDNG
jgi:hypothetical protein